MSTAFPQTSAPRDLSSVTRYDGELPRIAFDPRITVVCDLDDYTVGCCSLCFSEEQADWRITYRYTLGGTPYPVDVCESHAGEQLRELLDRSMYHLPAQDLTLHLPLDWAPDELSHLVAVRCEGQPGCTAAVSYAVEFAGRTHIARRECACAAHLPLLVDYAATFGDAFTPCTVSVIPVSSRELVNAA